MNIVARPARAGMRGFDCNTKVNAEQAKQMRALGFEFVVRYVGREKQANHDIDIQEFTTLLDVGLGVSIVQHVEPPQWFPSAYKGRKYGEFAVSVLQSIGFPLAATVWLDIEEVSTLTPLSAVIAYENCWTKEIRAAQFESGVYLGWNTKLSPADAYQKLDTTRYWGAYNLDKDLEPIVRGLCMKQYEEKHSPLPFAIDTNVVKADAKGDLPNFAFAQ